MRIGLVAPPWVSVPPVAYGGTETVLDALARGLVSLGHEVLLVTTADSTCPVPKHAVMQSAATEQMGTSVIELTYVVGAYEAVKAYDIVHDHTIVGPIYSERFAGLPVVTTCHGPFRGPLEPGGRFDATFEHLYRAIAGRVPVIGISHDQASRAGDIPVATVIHHGIDPAAFEPGDGDGNYVAFLGRMSPNKGVHRAALAARAAGIPLKIAARMSGWERDYFDAEVAPLLGGEIEYVGELDADDKRTLLRGARALVNPIRWPEPFGMVMIESLACATPVITFPEGAAPEIIDHGSTGFLCNSDDEMVDALQRIDELSRDACRHAVETRFSYERMARDHVKFYEQVLFGEYATAWW